MVATNRRTVTLFTFLHHLLHFTDNSSIPREGIPMQCSIAVSHLMLVYPLCIPRRTPRIAKWAY